MNKIIYIVSFILFLIGGIRVILTETYEFRYYTALKLGIYSLPIGIIIIFISFIFLYFFYNELKKGNNKIEYSICPKCQESYTYIDLKDGICPKCDIKTIDLEEYYKK